ncbi:MAG: alpha-2-macroglobulin [Treponema sp.]|nr:alpha-2-macroglobulin [Treponema sp.]
MFFRKIALAAMAAAALSSCSNKDSSRKNKWKEEKKIEIKIVKEENGEYASFDAMKAVFTPDFSYKYVEEDKEDEKEEASGKKRRSKEKSESGVSEIREPSKYKTKYFEKRKKIDFPKTEKDLDEGDPTKAFYIEEYGPQGKIVGDEERPNFFVVFSQPAKRLEALEEPMTVCDVMSIEPPLNGVYRWLGSRHLAFEASQAADPSETYKVSIKKDFKSLAGKSLEGMTEFSTKAEPLAFMHFAGGYVKDSEDVCDNYSGALPKYANRAFLRVNYMLTEKRLSELLQVSVGGKKANFSLQADYNKKAYPWGERLLFDQEKGMSNSFVATISDEIPFNAKIEFSFKGSDAKESYSSLKPFIVRRVPKNADYSRGKKGNPITITFSQRISEESVLGNISFDFDYKLTKDNFEIFGNELTIFNLPISYEEGKKDNAYTIFLHPGLKDLYGQGLLCEGGKYQARVELLPPKSYVKFTDSYAKLLESQFKPKLFIECQNILQPSFYKVTNTENPLYLEYAFPDSPTESPSGTTKISTSEKNKRFFEEIDLSPYLNESGFGWIDFEAQVKTRHWNQWEEKFEELDNTDKLTIQVTDLGVTARIGINRAVVMARSLKENKPIQGAQIMILAPSESEEKNLELEKNLIAKGKTDKDGFLAIEFTEEQVKKIEKIGATRSVSNIRILAEKDNDKAVFYPSSHNSWRENVSTQDLDQARKAVTRAFIFTDRGLYKPGETVSFRGIVRDQSLGQLVPRANQAYSLTVSQDIYEGKEIVPQINGSLSESGGFYGSFKLPDQIEPGNYKIRYMASDYEWSDPYVSFTVANFERLKFEASLSAPKINYYSGDRITANLKASYLAGGSLSGAEWESTWFKQACAFEPKTIETKGYSFGPTNYYSGRILFSNGKGRLDNNGEASVSCSSEKITDGSPCIYHLEAGVTDISNQKIWPQTNIMIHPAKFYVGIKKPLELSGFAKTNSKLDFPFILVNADGKEIDDKKIVSSLEYKLERESWSMANEQSVNDSIYTRWEKTDILEASGKIEVQSKGSVSVELKEPGKRKLTISGRDANGNWTTSEYDFYVTGGSSSWHDPYNSDSINLTPDKSIYNPGETAKFLMESPLPAGDYLITVEREGIFTEEIKHFDSPANTLEIPVSINYMPVAYLAVSSYSVRSGEPTHQYGEPDLDKPKGYFGVTPIFVNAKAKSFNVKIESDKKVYKPGEKANLTLTATRGGKALEGAELTLMAVDRGVLDLIDYHVPNPIEFFYDKYNYPLCVMGGDSRDMLMDPVTYSVKNLTGGDAYGDDEKDGERKDFRPTALFEPVLVTDKNGKATCSFTMPDSLTAYRLTAFGVKDEIFSLNEDEIKVQNSINVQQIQPRRLRERDTAECGVLITNLDKDGQKVTVSVQARSPQKNTAQDELEGRVTVSGKAFVDGETEKTVYVASEDSTVVFFDVAAEQSGTVELVYTVKSPAINERIVSPILIEKTFVYETVALSGGTDGEEKDLENETIVIPSWAKEGRGDLSVTLDTSRLGLLGGAVQYLFDYPYGCLEQQASKVLPLLLFAPYIDAFGMESKVSDPKKCAESVIKSWAKSQHSNGGFPYWPEDSFYESLYVSIRIANVCAAAKKAGLKETDLKLDLEALKRFIINEINNKKANDEEKALACKVFALLGDKGLDAELLALTSSFEKLSLGANADIASAWAIKGNAKKAEECANKIRPYLQPSLRSVSITQKNIDGFYAWWESDSSKAAKILDALLFVNANDNMVDRLLFALLKQQSKGYWKNTASTSCVIEAISNYIQKRKLDDTDCSAKALLNKDEILAQSFKGAAAKEKTLKLPFESQIISSLPRDKEISLAFEKSGKGRLFYTVQMKYALPEEAQTKRDEGIKVDCDIFEYESQEPIKAVSEDSSIVELDSSKLYKARVKITSSRNRDYLALRCPIPSGAEILDSTFVTTGSAGEIESSGDWRHWISNKTIRDNEIQFFWDTFKSGECEVTFTFRPSRRGLYPTPPAQAECMYEPEIFGRSDGYLFVIK